MLTKEQGKIKEQILKQIRSIVDDDKVVLLIDFVKRVYQQKSIFVFNTMLAKSIWRLLIENIERTYL